MSFNHEQAFEAAYNLKVHQKKLEEIKKSPTKRLDNHLPDIYLNVKKGHGYKALWWSYKVDKENKLLLEKLIQIKEKKRNASKMSGFIEKPLRKIPEFRSLSNIKNTQKRDFNISPLYDKKKNFKDIGEIVIKSPHEDKSLNKKSVKKISLKKSDEKRNL